MQLMQLRLAKVTVVVELHLVQYLKEITTERYVIILETGEGFRFGVVRTRKFF